MQNSNPTTKQSNNLLFFGILLFLFGLISGLFIPMMANTRMGLSAHLEGIMNGMFLVVLGIIWNKLTLTERWFKMAFILTIYGSFANFIAVLIGAITGYGKLMPLAGGVEGTPILEGIISFLLVSLALAMVAVCLIILKGLYNTIRSIDI
jgi:(hydroxyamino)benzene mutase